MRIAIAAAAGIVLAVLMSYGVVRVVNTAGDDPVTKPLYNYGSR
jgi:hypothetical protein